MSARSDYRILHYYERFNMPIAVEAQRALAEIDRVRDQLARTKAAIDDAWEQRDDIDDPYVQGWLTGLLETLEGLPPYSDPVDDEEAQP